MARQQGGRRQPGQPRKPYRGPGWTQSAALGVDVGGVIVALTGRDEDTSFFGTRPLETPATDGVFQALATLSVQPFDGRIHLVSKAGPKVASNTRDWMDHHDFFNRTLVSPANVHFVRERRDKAAVCQRLGITHFVDDRLDVLAYLETVENRYLFRGGTDPKDSPPGGLPGWVTPVENWAELVTLLTAA